MLKEYNILLRRYKMPEKNAWYLIVTQQQQQQKSCVEDCNVSMFIYNFCNNNWINLNESLSNVKTNSHAKIMKLYADRLYEVLFHLFAGLNLRTGNNGFPKFSDLSKLFYEWKIPKYFIRENQIYFSVINKFLIYICNIFVYPESYTVYA